VDLDQPALHRHRRFADAGRTDEVARQRGQAGPGELADVGGEVGGGQVELLGQFLAGDVVDEVAGRLDVA
jgi:hypothetical protein